MSFPEETYNGGGNRLDVESEMDYAKNQASNGNRRRVLMMGLLCFGIVALAAGIGVAVASKKKDTASLSGAPGPAPGGVPAPAPTDPTTPEQQKAHETIKSSARFGGSEFNDPNSYQSAALAWVTAQDLPAPGSPLLLEDQAIQLYALACIYYNTYSARSSWTDFHFGSDVAIPGWFTSRGWLGDPSSVCDWYGITCNNSGKVEKIELATNGLTGYFPPEAALLHDSLNYLDLYNNIVHNKGDLGNSFLGELTNLEYLFYGTTSFEYDGIPTEIGALTKLKEYDCSYSLYFGDLRSESFEKLSNLNYLVMDGNAYNDTLPAELVSLPELEFLYAGFSFVEGNLEFMKDMPKIFELWLDDNPGLAGSIPTSIGDVQTLVSFSATNCGLTGTIPTELGQLTEMIQMWLYDNDLDGTIPTELGNLIKMKIFNVQKNEITGSMPGEICGRRDPFGRLEDLEADCDGEVECTCCTCCGEDCIDL